MSEKYEPRDDPEWVAELQEYERQEREGDASAQELSEEQRRRQEGASRQYHRRDFKPFDYRLSS